MNIVSFLVNIMRFRVHNCLLLKVSCELVYTLIYKVFVKSLMWALTISNKVPVNALIRRFVHEKQTCLDLIIAFDNYFSFLNMFKHIYKSFGV